jgi:hypothetical protein
VRSDQKNRANIYDPCQLKRAGYSHEKPHLHICHSVYASVYFFIANLAHKTVFDDFGNRSCELPIFRRGKLDEGLRPVDARATAVIRIIHLLGNSNNGVCPNTLNQGASAVVRQPNNFTLSLTA